MPYQNGTGPQGNGPATGRGMGNCSNRGSNCQRRGLGRGVGCNYQSSTPTKDEEKEILESDKKYLEKELEAISERLNDLK